MIARVFPRRTSYTPIDDYAFYGAPDLFVPDDINEVHISCTFTWDIPLTENLAIYWNHIAPVKIGGVAYKSKPIGFTQGMYVKSNVVFTSRGCPNNCDFCFVPEIEGKLVELETICEGNIIQDNNFFACSETHKNKVYSMLKTQKKICFKGGIQAERLTDNDIEQLRGLKISELWFACDRKGHEKILEKVADRVKIFGRNKLRCYVLIGDNMTENEARLRRVYELGFLPFAQLYRDDKNNKYSKEWQRFARTWSRPAAYKSMLRDENRQQNA
jgi:hypothetical protein